MDKTCSTCACKKVCDRFLYGYENCDNYISVDAVHREVLAQVMWERDVAIKQLEEHGIPFGCKADVQAVVRCGKCKHYREDIGWCDINSHFVDDNDAPCSPEDSHNWRMFTEDDFCSYGERKVSEDDR